MAGIGYVDEDALAGSVNSQTRATNPNIISAISPSFSIAFRSNF